MNSYQIITLIVNSCILILAWYLIYKYTKTSSLTIKVLSYTFVTLSLVFLMMFLNIFFGIAYYSTHTSGTHTSGINMSTHMTGSVNK